MRRNLFLLSLLFAATATLAQTPNTISFQGTLTAPGSDVPVTDGSYGIDFALYDDVNTLMWSETQPTVQVNNGLINVQLGSVTPLEISDFYQPLFLQITINGETLSPRIVLNTVPFAQASKAVVGTDSIIFRVADQKAGIADQTNTALGYLSFAQEQGSGFFNQAFGNSALQSNNGGSQNVAVGSYALQNNTTGVTNIAIGYNALNTNSTSSDNLAIGAFALENNTDGSENVAVGRDALIGNTTGRDNTAIGSKSMVGIIGGIGNTAVGSGALSSNGGDGSYNVAVGYDALINNNASNNTGVGTYALLANTIGNSNTALGFASLESNTTGSENIAIGGFALNSNTTGIQNIAMGSAALLNNVDGNGNIAIGQGALSSGTTISGNIAIGFASMASTTTGYANVAVGPNTLALNETGQSNIALGNNSLGVNVSGNANMSMGINAMRNNTIGNQNIAIGNESLNDNVSGTGNVAVGDFAMHNNVSGTNNTTIGRGAEVSTGTLNNATAIGAGAVVSQSNSLVLGNNVNVGIGTSTPQERLSVVGDIQSSDSIKADVFAYNSSEIRYYSMLPQAFSVSSTNAGVTHIEAINQIYRAVTGGTGAIAYMFGQINLPQGAEIIGFTANVYDGEATYDITVSLIRKSVTTANTPQVVSSVSTSGTPFSTQLVSPAFSEIVNNQNNAYGIRFETRDNAPSVMVLYNARVAYRIKRLD